MDQDLLGFDRYEQHSHWRCEGRVEGGVGEIDDIAPLAFAVERNGDRWLLTTGTGDLVAVGDVKRDLVSGSGGLERLPAGHGFKHYLATALLSQQGAFGREAISTMEVVSTADSTHAGRPAINVTLRYDKGQMTLGVDAETGIWTYVGGETEDGAWFVEVDGLAKLDHEAAEFVILDSVPDIDLSARVAVSEHFQAILTAVREASGLDAEMLVQDEDDDTFRIVLLDQGEPVGMVSRSPLIHVQSPQRFGGSQEWSSDGEQEYHVDVARYDPRWAYKIRQAMQQ